MLRGWGRGGALLTVVWLTGCSTSRMTVDLMAPVLDNTVTAALRSEDLQLVEDALPTSLLLLEGMVGTHPDQKDVARLASMLNFAYAFAFVEKEDPVRALTFYEKGRELGWRAFGRPKLEDTIREGTFAELDVALEEIRVKDVSNLLWAATNWAMWIQLNLAETRAVADLARLMPLMERLAELDDTEFWGMPRILLGSLHASRPVILGGNPERALTEFDRAFEISDRNLHLAQVFFAKTYCVQTFDAEAFESSLQEVLNAPDGVLPEAAFLNRIAYVQARDLLAQAEEIFE